MGAGACAHLPDAQLLEDHVAQQAADEGDGRDAEQTVHAAEDGPHVGRQVIEIEEVDAPSNGPSRGAGVGDGGVQLGGQPEGGPRRDDAHESIIENLIRALRPDVDVRR